MVVVGGGMVGSASAVGFAQQGRRVAVIEKNTPQPFEVNQQMDLRVSAISHRSVDLLNQLGAWDSIVSMRVCPYRRLETWESDICRLKFHADSLELQQLGYIVENRLIQLGLWQQFNQHPNLTVFEGEALASISMSEQQSVVILESGKALRAALVVGADGANSAVRQQMGVGITAWDYRQHCLLINVETDLPQQDITWQWFTPTGPRSFLPLSGNRGSLVWYDSPQVIKRLMSFTAEQLQVEIERSFPKEVGGVKVISSGSFPLTRRHAQSYSVQNCVLVGDSAHTINPLAGQGVNLGFKDVQALLAAVERDGISSRSLKKYEMVRRPDNLLMQTGMDMFYKGFSNQIPPLTLFRNAALRFADHAGPIKKQVLKYAIGL
ncbi:3-demethoxyubiquinol 3-hydroxylase [Vibrio hippocampi]|uniref:3-demethoxyubiquinol 3-hydroxylase n=1 Tax=Vibrio hippocampi TaxID=654686 RepID=A0ABM8ZIH6_9VIBR|nr:3-demethoxyubiquinol 3-hydroxylase [Vibrio hippocampi]